MNIFNIILSYQDILLDIQISMRRQTFNIFKSCVFVQYIYSTGSPIKGRDFRDFNVVITVSSFEGIPACIYIYINWYPLSMSSKQDPFPIEWNYILWLFIHEELSFSMDFHERLFIKLVSVYPRWKTLYLKGKRHARHYFFYYYYIQGYPQRMRLQRRLYRIYTVYFHIFRILCNLKLVSFVAMAINWSLKDNIQGRRRNRHILWVSGRLYNLILCV